MCECLSLYLFKTAREHKKMAKLVAIAIDATRIEMQYRMPREIRLRSSTRCPSVSVSFVWKFGPEKRAVVPTLPASCVLMCVCVCV